MECLIIKIGSFSATSVEKTVKVSSDRGSLWQLLCLVFLLDQAHRVCEETSLADYVMALLVTIRRARHYFGQDHFGYILIAHDVVFIIAYGI